MRIDPTTKYKAFEPIPMTHRAWPSQVISRAPIWCSVDLRDGNQALANPMGPDRKRRLFDVLVQMGFKEIEVGFPAASQTDFDFIRALIEGGLLPDDVVPQVLTQARGDQIARTFESLRGCPKAIVHLYNSTSELQRRTVFKSDRRGIIDLAVAGARRIAALAADTDTEIVYQYSPESFTGTELDFAVEICGAVMEVYQPTADRPMILNLPATVEMSTPNVYADQIEWFSRNIGDRDAAIISVHPHNDRGTAVAAAELALMAGADRIEGTLFGNGERTGNVDLVTLALNMFSQGVDPGLDLSDIQNIVDAAEHCTGLPVHQRHPYAGTLVFTAFSGSHQDAINKGLKALRISNSREWQVPYLPIDPEDLGRTYEAIIRINSQSGKGGIAYLIEHDYGLTLPPRLQAAFSKIVQRAAEGDGAELNAARIWDLFQAEYLRDTGPVKLLDYRWASQSRGDVVIAADMEIGGKVVEATGRGGGPIDAFVAALRSAANIEFTIADYHEQAQGAGADAVAVAYVEVEAPAGERYFGVARHRNIVTASLHAVTAAAGRLHARGEQ